MPALDHDLILKLDEPDTAALVASRKAARSATIARNVAAAKLARATAAKGAGSAEALAAASAQTTYAATAKAHDDSFKALRDNVLALHGKALADFTDVGLDPVQGHLVGKREPLLAGTPAVERRRLPLTDKQLDDCAASYDLSCAASDDAHDLVRAIEAYLKAHPPVDGEPGRLIPEPQALQDLRAAFKAKLETVKVEQAKQGTIWAALLTAAVETEHGQRAGDSIRLDLATGDLVLGAVPAPDESKTVEEV